MVLVPLSSTAAGLHHPDFCQQCWFCVVKSCQAHLRPLKHPINNWVFVVI